MEENIKLTREQVIIFAFIGICGNMVYSHTWVDNAVDRSAWFAALIGILLLIPFGIWILFLGQHRQGSTIFDIIEIGLGKYVSSLIIIVYILINIAMAVAMLNLFDQMIKTYFFKYTPSWIIFLNLICIGIIFISSGIKVFGRLSEILSVLGILDFFGSFIFAFNGTFRTEYVIPIFDTSLLGFLKGVVFLAGAASEYLLLLMVIVGSVPSPGKHYRWVVIGVAFSAVVFSSAILVIMGMLSPEYAKRIAYGGVNASFIIKIGEFIQGLEVFVFGTYQFIALGKVSMCLYCIWTSSKKMLNNKIPRIQLIVAGILIFIPSMWLNSYNKAYLLAVLLGGYIILPFSILVLLLASLSIMIKNKKNGSASE